MVHFPFLFTGDYHFNRSSAVPGVDHPRGLGTSGVQDPLNPCPPVRPGLLNRLHPCLEFRGGLEDGTVVSGLPRFNGGTRFCFDGGWGAGSRSRRVKSFEGDIQYYLPFFFFFWVCNLDLFLVSVFFPAGILLQTRDLLRTLGDPSSPVQKMTNLNGRSKSYHGPSSIHELSERDLQRDTEGYSLTSTQVRLDVINSDVLVGPLLDPTHSRSPRPLPL